MNKEISDLKQEVQLLREVYEAARQVFRFNGVDKNKTTKAVDRLDDAIEAVKLLDSGLMEFMEDNGSGLD
jgi:hypothetical protein